MNYTDEAIKRDVEHIASIPIIPTLLNVICETTGMGFAAVARVTDSRWITCSVRDDIQFGLVPGSELKLETTICNEIKGTHKPVVIEHVKESTLFCDHHTPLMYGFQSYISFPIILKSGAFFGTLCAIDPKPRKIDNTAVLGTFAAFAELISSHLQQIDQLADSDQVVYGLNRDLINSLDENRQYRHISTHTLQEPLRKLGVFSEMLINAAQNQELDRVNTLALRIQKSADRFSELIKDLTDFSDLNYNSTALQPTSLLDLIKTVKGKLQSRLDIKLATVSIGELPTLSFFPDQMEKVFYHLFDNAIKFSKVNEPLLISISARPYERLDGNTQLSSSKSYVEIILADNGIGIEENQLEKIFDVFSQLPTEIFNEGIGTGLSISRKVIRNHFGQITIDSELGKGTTVSLILPTS